MLDLDKKVFGNITTKEIIGAQPPAFPDTQEIFERELEKLLTDLQTLPKGNLEKLLDQQKQAESHVNSRPGAMALAQNKIKIFNEHNQKYIRKIKEILDS